MAKADVSQFGVVKKDDTPQPKQEVSQFGVVARDDSPAKKAKVRQFGSGVYATKVIRAAVVAEAAEFPPEVERADDEPPESGAKRRVPAR